ncbi:unnamed protein product, partial [Polarella glacialis]
MASTIWQVIIQQQAFDSAVCSCPGMLQRLERFFDELAQGERSDDSAQEMLRLRDRVLRRGCLRGASGDVEAVVLWTTDFAHTDGGYKEVLQVWAVCGKGAEEAR